MGYPADRLRANCTLQEKRFGTILADPPWPYLPGGIMGNGGRGKEKSIFRAKPIIQTEVRAHYLIMSINEIKQLPVNKLAADNAHLWLWTTNSFIVEAYEVTRAWGFEPKSFLTWVKIKHQPEVEVSMKTGYWFRSATEHIVFGVRGNCSQPQRAMPTAYLLPREQQHSKKPEFFYELIEQQSPGPYLELFSRHVRSNWDCWGNQVISTVKLDSKKS